ncbi:MAG TPA: type I restriction-modification enzyme R subunit C-terminal domain-containing protein [Thermoanaerobaculia bacterium]|jgi:type I restriction enzyme R subunit
MKPEDRARVDIDRQLTQAGWVVQDADKADLHTSRGVAIREFPLARGHGKADYLLYVDRRAVGAVEAKKQGTTLTAVEVQSAKYSEGLPANLPAVLRPLPFLYEGTGIETHFTNLLDPDPRSRLVFHYHQPATIAEWLSAEPLWLPAPHGRDGKPASLRLRLRNMPAIEESGLWPAQLTAVRNLEKSLAENRPRALIQMATGSGKTFTAVTSIYRLIKHGGAQRVLFLVDRANLGRQALKEFQTYATPDDGRKFTELYNVQRLTSNRIDPVARVCISTIQRLYAMLQGKELAEEDEEPSLASLESLHKEPLPLVYNPAIPIETFDVVFVDECHRSIYTLWRQVLEYFDAFQIGLTATPSMQTFGYFNRNLVMEYGHEQAVADGVNVDFDFYRIRTKITESGSKVDAGFYVDRRDRETRKKRWEQLDQDFVYTASELDRDVVAPDQIRTVIRTFRDRLPEIFPGRKDVPKTLIYAKDDAHAEDIVQVVREEFAKGNDFAQKITYRAGTARVMEGGAMKWKSTGVKPEDLLSSFRNSYNPRIAVTVDMIATGTDIKPLEVVMFLRQVRSRNLFEQMKGRGVRVIGDTDFQVVTPGGGSKTRFVIVDAVGVTEQELSDTHPLERRPTVPLEKLFQAISFGTTDADVISTVAGRLARLDRQLSDAERAGVAKTTGRPLAAIVSALVTAADPDARAAVKNLDDFVAEAVRPLTPAFRQQLLDLKRSKEQIIDTVSADEVLDAGFSTAAKERAESLVKSFEQYIEEHKDEITALQVLYSKPHGRRLTYEDIKALAETIEAPPRQWTPERLWQAYETMFASRVRGAPARVLTNLVSLVRFAMTHDELVPFPDIVDQRFDAWVAQQEQKGRRFTAEQRQWLEAIRDHVAANLEVRAEDFEYAPFAQRGGLGAAHRVFGTQLKPLLEELTGVLAA